MNMATMRMRLKRAAAAAAGTNTTGSGLNVNAIAYGFTKSLSSSFLGAVDVKKLASQAMSGSNLTSMVGPTLVGAGSGLGAGAAQGLGLSNAAVNPSTGADAAAPEVAHNFAYELTTSFLANGTLSSLQSKLMSAMSMTNISAMLGPAAQGAGSGIGQGAAVGLGLQDPSTAQSPMGGDVAMVARDFSYGLTSNFLANGTVSRLQAKAAALLGGGSNSSSGAMMSALQKVSVSKAAEGLARGLVDGAGQSVANMGGFQAILNGANSSEVMMQAATPIFKSDDFNDTTGGVATSFGQGLGGQGVTLIAQMLGMSMSLSSNGSLTPSIMGNNSTTPASLSSSETPANNLSTPAIRARSYRSSSPIIRKSAPLTSPFLKFNPHQKRVDDPTNLNISDITSGLLTGVNVTSLDVLLQKGVDTLTCEGIGGFVEIFKGLKASGSIPATGGSVMLPNATFTVASQGNEFLINPATQVILVNGIGISRLTILIVAHGMYFFPLVFFYFFQKNINLTPPPFSIPPHSRLFPRHPPRSPPHLRPRNRNHAFPPPHLGFGPQNPFPHMDLRRPAAFSRRRHSGDSSPGLRIPRHHISRPPRIRRVGFDGAGVCAGNEISPRHREVEIVEGNRPECAVGWR